MTYNASVIIPVYNAEKTLRRCVESVVLGTERNLEVILVEDCGKDNSWGVCQELEREFPNVTAVRNKHNSGVSATRNRGLELAQGEYILFVDSDDWVSSRYAMQLLWIVQNYPNALCICGHHFIDYAHDEKRDYLWSDKGGESIVVCRENYFTLMDKFLLQQLWNKIFRRDVILQAGIRFDEAQSMGEDFQFVLDYMEGAQIQQCVVCNEPLYYYIRWNDNSLMSSFGLIQNTQELHRMEQLYYLTGLDDPEILHNHKNRLKQNYLYHICRNPKLSKDEKLFHIERIMEDGDSEHYYRRQKEYQAKERLVDCLAQVKKLPGRAVGKIQRKLRDDKIRAVKKQASCDGVTVISQNCIGGVLYHDVGAAFLSPTINLFFSGPDFVKFVLNLKYYLDMELVMSWGEDYPIGHLGDIVIHFMHYDTCHEAKAAWERRTARIKWDKIVVLCTDMEGFSNDVFAQWKTVPYPKVLFTANPEFAGDPDSVFYPQYQSKGCISDLIAKREFYKDGKVLGCLKINN